MTVLSGGLALEYDEIRFRRNICTKFAVGGKSTLSTTDHIYTL